MDEDKDVASTVMLWLVRRFEEVGVEEELVDLSHSEALIVGVVWLVSGPPLPIISDRTLWLILWPNLLATLFKNRADDDLDNLLLFDFWSSPSRWTLLFFGGVSGWSDDLPEPSSRRDLWVNGSIPFLTRRFLMWVFQWFLISLSVLPGNPRAMADHLINETYYLLAKRVYTKSPL